MPPRPLENSQLRRGALPEGSPDLQSPSISITRVPRVERPTINADIQGVPALLGAVVAINAKALQSASQELVPIPLMRNDVIGHGRRPHVGTLQTKRAKWMALELHTPTLLPTHRAVPASPWFLMPC